MSEVKHLLSSLLWDIYGRQQYTSHQSICCRHTCSNHTQQREGEKKMSTNIAVNFEYTRRDLEKLNLRKLIDMCAILKVEIRLMGYFLERVLINRDRNRRHQEVLCGFVDAILHLQEDNAHPKMRFSLSPPPPKSAAFITSPISMQARGTKSDDEALVPVTTTNAAIKDEDAASDYNQWLHAMKLVARLPGGMPPEFRRKLWLSLADKYLKAKNIDWAKEEEKCFCEKWREDDEELGIQIVKDLHRTGSNLCTGPAASINQAKLKRILLGYARYNPEVGYCQGFNMLGALILQVMEKEESEAMKVMIYLVEGVLPPGYFHGSMGGLQADMGVFRDLMQTKLPRLAKHLQKLQGPIENAYEPPLTNVFTMQWFLTMFCTCLPMSCVLRVWDLVLIEGSDVLLRTALVLWSLLEERVLSARTADDFYCKMGSFSSELLNGHLIDSNGLIEKVVQLGPIPDIQKLRDKHLYNITPLRHKQGLQLYYDDEETGSDEESRLAVATVWGLPWGRRGSHGQSSTAAQKAPENKDRLALDISLLKKQYDRLRERQKQAHIILTTACSTARQGVSPQNTAAVPVNQLLIGRPAIITNKGRRGPPLGAVPPARKPSLPTVLHSKPPERQLKRGETLHWRDADLGKRRRDSLTWKEIKADRANLIRDGVDKANVKSQKLRSRIGKSDSSSYSEESDEEDEDEPSSTDTSLCDDDDPNSTGDKTLSSSIENSPKRKSKSSRKQKEAAARLQRLTAAVEADSDKERQRPKSWAPSSNEIPFTLMTSESPVHSGDEQRAPPPLTNYEELLKEEEDSATESDRAALKSAPQLEWNAPSYSSIAGDLATSALGPLHVQTDVLELPVITSTSQLSPLPDITSYINNSTISPLPTPKPHFVDSTNSLGSGDGDGDQRKFNVSDDGVTNEYFERVNSVERPTKLDLFYSLNEEDGIRDAYKDKEESEEAKLDKKCAVILSPGFKDAESAETVMPPSLRNADEKEALNVDRRMELLMDYSEKSSAAFIAEATNELSSSLGKEKFKDDKERYRNDPRDNDIPGEVKHQFHEDQNLSKFQNVEPQIVESYSKRLPLDKHTALSNASRKRRDPRRLTLTRSSTIDIEERFQALERRLSSEKLAEDKLKSKHDSIADLVPKEMPSHKQIPSTVDLEERFNTLERQFSTGRGQSAEIIESSIQKDNSTNPKIPHEPIESPPKANRARIPSTLELENRFNALERQLSSSSLPGKSAINMKSHADKEGTEETQTPPNTPIERSSRELTESESKTGVESDTVGEGAEPEADSARPRLKKLPSTAELEDRFNALERKLSLQKTSPSKIKKEPPDGMEEDHSKQVAERDKEDAKTEEEKSELKEEEKEAKVEEKIVQQEEQKRDEIAQKSAEERNTKEEEDGVKPKDSSHEGTKEATKDSNIEEQKTEVELAKKKSPPSTEELEKRFNALEKQMSTTSVEAEPETKRRSSQAIQEEKPSTSKAISKKEEPVENKHEESHETKPRKDESDKNLEGSEGKPKETSSSEKEPKSQTNDQKDKKTSSPEGEIKSQTSGRKTNKEDAKETSSKNMEMDEDKTQKRISSFEAKCKSINEKLADKTQGKTETKTSTDVSDGKTPEVTEKLSEKTETKSESRAEHPTPQRKSSVAAEEKGEVVKKDVEQKTTSKESETANQAPKEAEKDTQTLTKRRASEPPTTEDLEKRFESLKRRMSTKTIIEKGFGRTERTEEVSDKRKASLIEESNEAEAAKSSDTANKEVEAEKTVETKKKEPPSTADLESRFEALQRSSSISADKSNDSKKKAEVRETIEEVSQKVTTEHASVKSEKVSPVERKKSNESPRTDTIPAAPPMPPTEPSESSPIDIPDDQRRALIEEFQSKIKTQPNDENLKPSDINPNRKPPPSPKTNKTKSTHSPAPVDGTSETHANSAFFRSRNYEPWHSQSNKMVRRFSDLPSRADLENRLQFLETQLIAKFYKQRCASDSEVASRKHLIDVECGKPTTGDEMPSTSRTQSAAEELEKRVQALEKQLSENSLKLLEAIRVKAEEGNFENATPRCMSTETIDATGKELVRYTHEGELEEAGCRKPINISINIKMMLNKDADEKAKKKTDNLPTTAELEKRLEVIEQQLKSSKSDKTGGEEQKINEPVAEPSEAKELEPIVMEKVQKDVINEEFKNETKEPKVNEKTVEVNEKQEKDIKSVKAEKTLENQQIARSAQIHQAEEVARKTEKETTKSSAEVPQQKVNIPHKMSKEMENEKALEKEKYAATEKQTPVAEKKDEEPEPKQKGKPEEKEVADESANSGAPKSVESCSKDKSLAREETTAVASNNEPVDSTPQASSNDPTATSSTTTSAIEINPTNPNSKTLVLLLDNEPKAVKVRRLTRANTEELEGLFQALEKQLSERNLVKSEDGKLMRAADKPNTEAEKPSEEAKELSKLSKEIEEFTKSDKAEPAEREPQSHPPEDYDWGPNPVKHHLKRKTVHLPSTRELEARFRSLERQIKLLEDVEKIDVEQRLLEIERKIKLQYSLSHEKDLSKFLELCEGKGLDEIPDAIAAYKDKNPEVISMTRQSPAATPTKSQKPKSPYTSPSRVKEKTPHTSPSRAQAQAHASRSPKRHMSPARQAPVAEDDQIPSTEDLEYRYRALDLKRSKSKESLAAKLIQSGKQPIHPLEMLLDPSPDDSHIPITGELEHRMRVLEEKRNTPSPPRTTRAHSSRSRSPTIEDLKRKKMAEDQRPKTPIHNLEAMVSSPTKKEPPTVEELEARMRALEEEQCFDFKTQKTYLKFNQKLKDIVSPSLSFEEFKTVKSREESPRRVEGGRSTTPKSALREPTDESYHRSTSPKTIRFRDDEEEYRPKSRSDAEYRTMVGKNKTTLQLLEDNSQTLHRILKTTLADSNSSISGALAMAAAEGLDEMGSRLMRETSPLQRTGSHTGVPLRTNDNINERLDSIKNTIKSIDTLCEEKPYHKEKCQRYIDSLFSDSLHFASKKSSLEDLSRSESRGRRDYAPSIRVSDHSQRPSDYYLRTSLGSADSIRSTSPLRAASPLHHRSNRDLRREISPRRRRDEEREEYESRVRRDYMLPNYFSDNHRALSSGSLTKFHKVDRQLETDICDERDRSYSRSASRSPLRSPYGSREMNTTTLHSQTAPHTRHNNTTTTTFRDFDQPTGSTYRHTSDNLRGLDSLKQSYTPVYAPGKLEIRHTTVTSTFYDRLLAEKEIEKKFSRPPSRSPVISPSVTSKSYIDLPSAIGSHNKTYPALSPTADAMTTRGDSVVGTTSYGLENRMTSVGYQLGSGSAYTTGGSISQLNSNDTNIIPNTNTNNTLTNITTNSFNSVTPTMNTNNTNTTTTTQYSDITSTGNCSTYQSALLTQLPMATLAASTASTNLELHQRNCQQLLMQIQSNSTTAAGLTSVALPTTTTTTTTATLSTTTLPTTSIAPFYGDGSSSALPSASNSSFSSSNIPITSLDRPTPLGAYNNTSSILGGQSATVTTIGHTINNLNLSTTLPHYSTPAFNPAAVRAPADGTPFSLSLYPSSSSSTLNYNNNNNSNTNAASELPKI